MLWIKEVEMVDSLEELKSSRSVCGKNFQILRCRTRRLLLLRTRSSRIPNSRRRWVSGSRKPQKEDRFLRGRQIALHDSTTTFEWLALIIQHWITLIYSLLLFMTVVFRNSIQDGMKFYSHCQRFPSDNILESLYNLRIRESAQLKTVLELYDMEIHQKISMPKISKIEDNGKEVYSTKLSTQDTGELKQEQWSRIDREWVAFEGGKGTCYQWKEKGQCSQGDRCSFRHERTDRAWKPEHTAATPSEPTVSRGRSVSRKRSIRGKSHHWCHSPTTVQILFEGYLHAIALWMWHLPDCQFYKTETGCKAGDKCLFPHHKVDGQPNKKPNQGYYSHTGRESDEKNAVAILKIVPQMGLRLARLGCVGFSTRQTVPRKPDAESLGINLEKYGSLSPRYVKQVSGTRKDHRLEKIQVKPRHQRSPYAMKFEDPPHDETEIQQRCARSKAWNLAKNIYKLKEKGQGHILLARGRMGTPGCVNKRAGGKRVCGLILERVCMWSASETLTMLSWRPWGHREILRRWWRPTARCEQIKKRRKMSNNWTYSWR